MNQPLTPQNQQELQPLHSPSKTPEEEGFVNLNEVVEDLIGRMKQESGLSRAIFRYETLPEVRGNRQQIWELFSVLFHSIVAQGSITSKPFVYIKCALQHNELMDLSIPANTGLYSLAVYTNIVANQVWHEQHHSDIATMNAILKSLHGNLHCSTIENTGCLYLITLPGKLL